MEKIRTELIKEQIELAEEIKLHMLLAMINNDKPVTMANLLQVNEMLFQLENYLAYGQSYVVDELIEMADDEEEFKELISVICSSEFLSDVAYEIINEGMVDDARDCERTTT